MTVEFTAGANGAPVVRTLQAGEGELASSATVTVPLDNLEASAPGVGTRQGWKAGLQFSSGPIKANWLRQQGRRRGRRSSQQARLLLAGLKAWADRRSLALPAVLFGMALSVYLLVRVIGLSSFPIYFSCDEAVNPVVASDFLANNLRDNYGEFLPTFFKNGGQYCISTSVYLQVLPTLLFGKSVFVDRLMVALVSLLGAVSSADPARHLQAALLVDRRPAAFGGSDLVPALPDGLRILPDGSFLRRLWLLLPALSS